ncbi:MAG: hypothetical protein H8D72_02500 [Planctomycetes bacterium]|nr:hypothetical protein [Planctomycetota bacterium]
MRIELPLAALALGFLLGCNTQRVPAPMGRPEGLILPPGQGDDYVPGPQEVIVLRHGDPVSGRRPSSSAGFPLTFHNKRLRLGSGGWVLSGTGGRAEVLWPGTFSSVQLFDASAAMIGEPSRAEPILSLAHCVYARIDLAPGDRVALVGGAELEGDPEVDSGPFEFKTVARDRIAVGNHGRTIGTIYFLQEELRIGPGELLELPLLAGGAGPRPASYAALTLAAEDGFLGPAPVVQGDVERLPAVGRLALRAEESAQVHALGVSVDLKPGEEVIFTPTGSRP